MCFTAISDAVRGMSCRYFDGRGRRTIVAGEQLDGGLVSDKDHSMEGPSSQANNWIVGLSAINDPLTTDHRRGGMA